MKAGPASEIRPVAHKTLRWLLMLDVLSAHGNGLTTKQIEERLADRQEGRRLSVRTIQRDLKEMEDSGLLALHRETTGGTPTVRIDTAFKGPIAQSGLLMSRDAALALKLALRHSLPLLPISVRKHLHGHEQRADRVLSSTNLPGHTPWLAKVCVLPAGQALEGPSIPKAVLDSVYDALASDTRLRVTYEKLEGGEPWTRELDVLGLVWRPPRVYLVVTSVGRLEPYVLNFSRIRKAESLATRSARPADFQLQSYVERSGLDITYSDGIVHLELQVTKDLAQQLAETPLSPDQQIVARQRSWFVKAEVRDTQALRAYLLGWGSKLEVLAPSSLRKALSGEVSTLHAAYSRKPSALTRT